VFVVFIGKQAKNVSESEAMEYVFGYTIANDVSASQLTHPDGHWDTGKIGGYVYLDRAVYRK
jgi:2-keto-4-pentenoate hydratase/2-oxohepta-3-ene-1,7-dioic acid hydratase in catechol pathway